MATNKLLQSLSEDPQLEKQIGCMAGILQLFDRHQVLTGRKFYGHKRIAGRTSKSRHGSPTNRRSSADDNNTTSGEHDTPEVSGATARTAKPTEEASERSSSNPEMRRRMMMAESEDAGSDASSSSYAHTLRLPTRLNSSRSMHYYTTSPSSSSNIINNNNNEGGNMRTTFFFHRRSVDTAERAAAAAAAAREALRELSRIIPDYPTTGTGDEEDNRDSRPSNIRDIVRASFSSSSSQTQQQQQDAAGHGHGLPRPIRDHHHSCRGSSSSPSQLAKPVSRRNGGAEMARHRHSCYAAAPAEDKELCTWRQCSKEEEERRTPAAAAANYFVDETLPLGLQNVRGSKSGGTTTPRRRRMDPSALLIDAGSTTPNTTNRTTTSTTTRFSFHHHNVINPSPQSSEPARASCAIVDSSLFPTDRDAAVHITTPRFSVDMSGGDKATGCNNYYYWASCVSGSAKMRSSENSQQTITAMSSSCCSINNNSECCDTSTTTTTAEEEGLLLLPERRASSSSSSSFSSNVVAKLMGLEDVISSSSSSSSSMPPLPPAAPTGESPAAPKKNIEEQAAAAREPLKQGVAIPGCVMQQTSSFVALPSDKTCKCMPAASILLPSKRRDHAKMPLTDPDDDHYQYISSLPLEPPSDPSQLGTRLTSTAEQSRNPSSVSNSMMSSERPYYHQPKNHHFLEDRPPPPPSAPAAAASSKLWMQNEQMQEDGGGHWLREANRAADGGDSSEKAAGCASQKPHDLRDCHNIIIPAGRPRKEELRVGVMPEQQQRPEIGRHPMNRYYRSSSPEFAAVKQRSPSEFSYPSSSSNPQWKENRRAERTQRIHEAADEQLLLMSPTPSSRKSILQVDGCDRRTAKDGSRHGSLDSIRPPPASWSREIGSRQSSVSSSYYYGSSPTKKNTSEGATPRTPEKCRKNGASTRRITAGGDGSTAATLTVTQTKKGSPDKAKQQEKEQKKMKKSAAAAAAVDGVAGKGGRWKEEGSWRAAAAEEKGRKEKKEVVKRRLNFAGGHHECIAVTAPPSPSRRPTTTSSSAKEEEEEEEEGGGEGPNSAAAKEQQQHELLLVDDDTESQGDKSTGTSSSCEQQPSPISVLEGPFYHDEPDADEDDVDYIIPSSPSITPTKPAAAASFVREIAPGIVDDDRMGGCNCDKSAAAEQSERRRRRRDSREQDLEYIAKLIHALQPDESKKGGGGGSFFKLAPLDPNLFALLEEEDHHHHHHHHEKGGGRTWERKLVFDAVDESLRSRGREWQRMKEQPWMLANKESIGWRLERFGMEKEEGIWIDGENEVRLGVEGGRKLLGEVREEVEGRLHLPMMMTPMLLLLEEEGINGDDGHGHEEEEDVVGRLLEAELLMKKKNGGGGGGDGEWCRQEVLEAEVGAMAFDMERMIFKDLIHQLLRELLLVVADGGGEGPRVRTHPPASAATPLKNAAPAAAAVAGI